MSKINCIVATDTNLIIKYDGASCTDTYKCENNKCVPSQNPADGTKEACEATCGKSPWTPTDIPQGLNIIGYSCGSACGAWGLKANQEAVKLLYGVGEIIVPWVTTLASDNSCSTTGILNEPKDMTDFLTNIDTCIKSDKWKGEKYISIGGWSQGYTFKQGNTKALPANIVSITTPGPIKTVVPCFNNTKDQICSDHPSTKILGGTANWGYWCFTQDKASIDISKTGSSQKGIGCDSGTLTTTPKNCWTSVGSSQINEFISYAQTNNYNGIDIDYESGGEVGNQPYNGYYMYLISKRANEKKLKVVHAPLNNFFFDNKNWDYVKYNTTDYTDIMNKSTTSTAGYKCEEPGGYGHLLFTLHTQGINLQNIFIQFYNNPPGPCDATPGAKNYCITSGTIGSIDTTQGLYYTMGNDPNLPSTSQNRNEPSGCSGGAGYVKDGKKTTLLQCNYEDERTTSGWAWEQDGFTYGGTTNKKMTGQFAGDPIGVFVKDDNPWLATKRTDDLDWQVPSTTDNDPTSTDKSMTIGGIKNTLYVMLLAKAYQPESPISFGTVPPRGGNASNLSTNMIKDIFMHLMGLQKSIDADVTTGKQSSILNELMMDLYKNGRLKVVGMDTAYWTKYWGGTPGTDKFCTLYPKFINTNMKESDKLFGGIGAWSIYWTELAKEGGTDVSWLETLKKIFQIDEMPATVPTECEYKGGGGGGTNTGFCCYEGDCPNSTTKNCSSASTCPPTYNGKSLLSGTGGCAGSCPGGSWCK
jgi:hypothetical protein